MHINFSVRFLFRLCFIALFIGLGLAVFFIYKYRESVRFASMGDILYNSIVGFDFSDEEKIVRLKSVVDSNIEPYEQFANMALGELYSLHDRKDESLKSYMRVIESSDSDDFVRSLAKIKVFISSESGDFSDHSNSIYYFTHALLGILSDIEDVDRLGDLSSLRNRMLNLRDSISVPTNIKNIVSELVKVYFSDYESIDSLL